VSHSYIEQAKSRSLADLIAFRAHVLPATANRQSRLVEQAHHLREELNWYYRQLDLNLTRSAGGSIRQVERWHQLAREKEGCLMNTLRELQSSDAEFTTLQNAGTIALGNLRSALPANTMLLEYYQARQAFYVCLLSRKRLEIVPLGPVNKVRDLLRLLQFQLSKFRLGTDYVQRFAESLQTAVQAHLHELYLELIAPVRQLLVPGQHLVLVPHDFLHYLPFHALFDGQHYLTDDFLISYAPSASVYFLCCRKEARSRNQSLILGIPDRRAPYIRDEVRAVASALPRPRVFVGDEASEERLRLHAPASRFVHIATHGLFRQDNPLFSSVRIGKSQLTLFDIYQLRLSCELVTLSGCGTGLNVVVGGDELLGLVRGLLYAGAKAALVTLWDVHDKSTAEFMKLFYEQLATNPDKAWAMRQAMLRLRESYPHPYFWAPFVLVGKVLPD